MKYFYLLSLYISLFSNKSGFIGGNSDSYLNVVESIPQKTNYVFASKNDALQINHLGKYIIQLDWESYGDVNIFIGCSYINLKEIGDSF